MANDKSTRIDLFKSPEFLALFTELESFKIRFNDKKVA